MMRKRWINLALWGMTWTGSGLLALGVQTSLLAESPLRITIQDDYVSVHSAQHLLLRYHYQNVPFKPYVQDLISPRGFNPLLDAPKDHLHHHALMFALDVDGVNFWEEQQAPGRERHRSFTDMTVRSDKDVACAGFTEQIDWIKPDSNALLLQESRTLRVPQVQGTEVTLLVWESQLKVPPGKQSSTLSGSHYHGLGMRFIEAMDAIGEFRNADGTAGEIFRGEERLADSIWCAYTAEVAGRPVTVAMLGHPENPRRPVTWFTMARPFAYLSATMKLHKEPLQISPDQPLKLRHLIAIWDEKAPNSSIDKLYQWWVSWTKSGARSAP